MSSSGGLISGREVATYSYWTLFLEFAQFINIISTLHFSNFSHPICNDFTCGFLHLCRGMSSWGDCHRCDVRDSLFYCMFQWGDHKPVVHYGPLTAFTLHYLRINAIFLYNTHYTTECRMNVQIFCICIAGFVSHICHIHYGIISSRRHFPHSFCCFITAF